jgi:hypothetical protein
MMFTEIDITYANLNFFLDREDKLKIIVIIKVQRWSRVYFFFREISSDHLIWLVARPEHNVRDLPLSKN